MVLPVVLRGLVGCAVQRTVEKRRESAVEEACLGVVERTARRQEARDVERVGARVAQHIAEKGADNISPEILQAMGMGDIAVTGRILEVDPPHRLVQTWVAAWHGEETTLTWDLKEYDGGAVVLEMGKQELRFEKNEVAMVRLRIVF